MTGLPNPYRVFAENNGGTASGGHIGGYAWGPPVVDEITMESLDRYRVAIQGYPWVLLVQPQQAAVWVLAAQHAGGGPESIDGDGMWMFPDVLPDVTIGKPMVFQLCVGPDEEPIIWHETDTVTSVLVTVDGKYVSEMTPRRGANWVIGTLLGPVHVFNFAEQLPRHRRFPDQVSYMARTAEDPYVQMYGLDNIRTLIIGQPIDIDAVSYANENPLQVTGDVLTITNLLGTRP